MLLKEKIKEIKIIKTSGNLDTLISGISYDSRKVSKGDLFVSIKGIKTDGHLYIKEALERGAKAFVVEKWQGDIKKHPQILVKNSRVALAQFTNIFYKNPSLDIKLIGVTGTNGKTTTTFLIESILNQSGSKTGLIGTIEYRIGEDRIVGERTTPESSDLCIILRKMIDKGVKNCVMEVSSHALDLHRVDFFNFYGVVFTNLSHEHLDYHHDIRNYFEAKKKLFTGENNISAEFAIMNCDDRWGLEISKLTRLKQIKYSTKKKADIYAKDITFSLNGTKFSVVSPIGSFRINTELVGEFNVYNILAAISTAVSIRIDVKDIKKGIELIKNIPGRFEKIDEGQPFSVIVDYAHTPVGVESIIKTVRMLSKGKIISLFGCGGDRDKAKRPIMGEITGRLSDFVIITSDNPRSEKEEVISFEIQKGILETKAKHSYLIELDRKKAIKIALKKANTGDTVLILGKGHENHQQFSNYSIEFDDRDISRQMLREMKSEWN